MCTVSLIIEIAETQCMLEEMCSSVTYKIENESPLKQYVFDFIFNIIGIRGEKCTSTSNRHPLGIYYGNNPSEDCKIVILEKSTDTIWQQLIEGKVSHNDIGQIVTFDIISAISSLVTDKVNRDLPANAYDTHERLRFSSSFQSRENIADVPVVLLYIDFIRTLLERKLSVKGIPLWLQGKKCAIGLSHDADEPDKYAILKSSMLRRNKGLQWYLLTALRKTKAAVTYATDKSPDDFWLFEDIMQEEEKYGFRSTFFVASVNQFDERGSIFDVAYNISDSESVKVLTNIVERGFEIGLHASYNAYHSKDHFVFEKEKLEHITGVKVAGLRHHRWHVGKDPLRTLRMHEEVGFEYDSSIAFNDHIGFRRSTPLPYNPWDEVRTRMINVIQLPVFCMDANLFYRPGRGCDAIEELKHYVGTIRQSGGLGVIDWHVRASFPMNSKYLNWGKTYITLLELLSHDNEIWVTNLGEIHSWLRERNRRISQLGV